MYKIISNQILATDIYRLVVEAKDIATNRHPGQFVIVQVEKDDERIPLTIVDSDVENGTITLIIQAIGESTKRIVAHQAGEFLTSIAGPLGKPTEIKNYGNIVCIAGGIGIAPLYPIIKGLKSAGNQITTILGSRTKDLLIMESDALSVSDRLIVTTDDGSYGMKGLVTVPFKQLIDSEKIDLAVIIGPAIMMKHTVALAKENGIQTIVSLNPIMVDGTGMCGGCRVTVAGKTKFACVDGPEFHGNDVDFDELIKRLGMYKGREDKHVCKIK
jgi:ferredoxin--NADP+ reductase